MTDDFKELVTELAKGRNFPENAAVLCTAINNEETQQYDVTAHFEGKNYYAMECIIQFLVEQFLKPLDDETAEHARRILREVIKKDEQRRANNGE